MEVHVKTGKRVTVVAQATNHLDLFKELDGLGEVFGISQCGACGSDNLRYRHRTNKKKHRFAELFCLSCFHKLAFGQHTDGEGSLFPRRKYHSAHPDVKAGKAKVDDAMPNGGWTKWVRPEADDE